MIISKTDNNIKRYFLVYTILSIIIAIFLSYTFKSYVIKNNRIITLLIVIFAVLTIGPSMLQLKIEVIPKALHKWKAIMVIVFYSFFVMPLLALLFAHILINKYFGAAFVISSSMPAASGSLAYILISGGDLELGTIIIVLGIFFTLFAAPFWANTYTNHLALVIPAAAILKPVVYILLTSLILGQIIRLIIIKFKGKKFIADKISVHLRVFTMISTIFLLFFAILDEGFAIINNPLLLFYLLLSYGAIAFTILLTGTVINKFIGLPYDENSAVIFTSGAKNMSLAIVIATISIGHGAALVPAIGAIIFRIAPVTYLKFTSYLKKLFLK